MIPGSANPLLLASAAEAGAYQIERSLRFNSSDSGFLSKNFGSAGNRKTWTWAGWVKRSGLSTYQLLISTSDGSSNTTALGFTSSDTVEFYQFTSGSYAGRKVTSPIYRDPSAWMHVVAIWDTSNATAADRMRIYVNGNRVTNFSTSSDPALNSDSRLNLNVDHDIGRTPASGGIYYFSGYLADIHFIDGQALDPTSFGEFDADTGIWNPIEYTGDYGLVSVANATGALPIYNTTDTYGTVKGTGTRTDANASSLVLAIPMDGANNGTTFTDESATIKGSGSAKIVTASGDAQTSTTQSKWYGSSGAFDGTGDYLSVASDGDFALGTGDFTVEFWYYHISGNDRGLFANNSGASVGVNFLVGAGGPFRIYNGTSANNLYDFSASPTANAWQHLAVVRNSGTLTLYVNGVASGSTNWSGVNAGNTATFSVGSAYGNARYANGYMQDFRLYKGTAKYTSDFNPVVSSNNSFHLPFDDNSSAAALGTDTSGAGNDWTPNNFSVIAGNGNYSSSGSYSYTGTQLGSLSNVYDGNSGTSGGSTSGVTFWGIAGGTATHSGFSKSFTSGVRIFYNVNTSGGSISVNGSSKSASLPPGGNTTVGVLDWTGSISSPFTSISITSPSGGVGVYVSGIEIDGILLIDYTVGAGNDSLVDTPTNAGTDTGVGGEVVGNYCTLNPLTSLGGTYSQGNLRFVGPSTFRRSNGTVAVSTGKWYWEITLANDPYSPRSSTTAWNAFGFGLSSVSQSTTGLNALTDAVILTDSGYYNNFSGSSTDVGTAFSSGDVLSCAVDLDANTFTFRRNNTQVATGTIGGTAGRELAPIIISYDSQYGVMDCNFGQRPFAYTAPSGFKALCTTNLDTPLIAKPSEVMDVALYTGNGSTQSITGLAFNPDLVWIKSRINPDSGIFHTLLDAVRGQASGFYKALFSNSTDSEDAPAGVSSPGTVYGGVTAFNSDGFTVSAGSTDQWLNKNTTPYVAWTWDAGSSTVSNTDGSITSSVRANPTAGFSVVTYTGNGSANQTVGHGLNAKPSLVIYKDRDSTSPWRVIPTFINDGYYLALDSTAAIVTISTSYFGANTSSVLGISGSNSGIINASGNSIVAYCFAPVDGYSSFGSYTGNGSADGPFVYTGFRPRWVMIKLSSGSGQSWLIHDTERDTYNVSNKLLFPNLSNAEATVSGSAGYDIDILSNGFKIRNNNNAWNASSATYIYAAFAESPQKFSRAR